MNGKKVLVLLNNIPLYGSERGNINVFYALKEKSVNSLFVTHSEYGKLYINPYLDKLGLKHTSASYIGKICKKESYKEYLIEVKNSLKGNLQLWRIIKKYKPDYIHIPTEGSFISMIMVLLLTKIPLVYRLGDAPRKNRKIFSFIWKYLIIPRVHKFVCISEFIKNKLVELEVPESKIEVIYNSPPYREITGTTGEINLNNGSTFNISYIGQITADKGVDLLVNAAINLCRKYNNMFFYLAGDHEWENPFAQELIQKIRDLNLTGRIIFLGMIENIQQLLKSSQLHVCPSVWEEPLSNVTVEAKEAGIPSIIFNSGGLPELIQHKVDGFICSEKSTAALIEAIEYYYLNQKELKKAKKASTESMERMAITMEDYRNKWYKVYADRK